MNTYIVTFEGGASTDPQDWRDVLSGAKKVAWATIYANGIQAASWIGGALSVSDLTTTNGIDPVPIIPVD